MITYQGKLGAMVAIPVFAQIFAAIDLTALAAEVAALLQASLVFTPPSVFGILGVVAAITAAINAGFQPPAFDFKANLLVKYGLLKAKLELLLQIQNILLSGSFRVYEYEGEAGTFGAELGATLAGADVDGGIAPGQSTYAVLLVAEGGTAGETTLRVIRHGAS
jgi:hypothetical protein